MTYLTQDIKPVSYMEEGKSKGIAVDLLKNVLETLDANVSEDNIIVANWPWAYDQALNGTNTVLYLTKRIPDREDLFKWARPVMTNDVVIFARRGTDITVQDLDNLNQYRIGIINNSGSKWILPAHGYQESNFVYGENVEDMLNLLDHDMIDL